MPARVARTRNLGTWTEAMFFGRIRSALRKMSMYWKPANQALKDASRPAPAGSRHKNEYRCAECGKWWKRKEVQVDHKVPCGSLRSWDDLPRFCQLLFVENPNGYDVLCKPCHLVKTKEQRK